MQSVMLKAFDLSVGLFVRGLTNLNGQLTKGEAHAAATGADPASLLHARLADDMYNLAAQTHWECEGAKLAVARLLGDAPAPLADEGKTFAELHERIDATVAHLRGVDPAALEAGLERTIEVRHRGASMTFRGDRFLTEFAIPNFFFHLTAAYGILRHATCSFRKPTRRSQGAYRPPSSNHGSTSGRPPPQTSIWLPVQNVSWSPRGPGWPATDIAVHVSAAGS
jgi:hypothetical protein